MLTFTPVTQRALTRLRRYYQNCNYRLCEYSAGVKLMWRDHLHPQFAEAAGCLIIRNRIEGKWCFDFPIPGTDGDVDAALHEIEEYCIQTGIPLSISVVPEEKVLDIVSRYPYFQTTNRRSWCDYLYEAENLREFPGRHYSGQRNHVNKFRKLYPTAQFRPLGGEDRALIEQFWQDYEAVFTKTSATAKRELALSKKMLRLTGKPYFQVGGMELDGRLISLSLAERCGDTLIVHIEKALYGYEGVYPATVQAFAQHYAVDGVRWLNREDDAGDRGLRTSKLQYLPTHLAQKYCFDVQNELYDLTEIPELRSERLTMSAFTEADKAAEAAGHFYISFGSDAVEEHTFAFVGFPLDGAEYVLMDMAADADSEETLYAMAAELIAARN